MIESPLLSCITSGRNVIQIDLLKYHLTSRDLADMIVFDVQVDRSNELTGKWKLPWAYVILCKFKTISLN